MRFPPSDRVLYTPNPLVEVICQVRFPRILAIDTTLPASFQDRLRARFPLITETGPIPAPGPLPENMSRVLGFDPALFAMARAFDFSSEDGVWRVSLTSQFLAVTTVHYERWEQFKDNLRFALDAFIQEYSPSYFTRIGLRYRDLIRRSVLGLPNAKWHELLKPIVIGELADPQVEASTQQVAKQLSLNLDAPAGAQVTLFHGFAKYKDQNETCYLIDADFFTETRTESRNVNDAQPTLDQFNGEAGRLFRWCISDQLHNAMAPTAVV